MNTIQPTSTSEFAASLRSILDDTKLFSRSDWAEFLLITEAAISQWLYDKTLPRPEVLRMILRTLGESDHIPTAPLERFWGMAGRPADEVTPLKVRHCRSIAEYLIIPIREAFDRAVALLKAGERENVLRMATSLCRHPCYSALMFDDVPLANWDKLFAAVAALPEEKRVEMMETMARRDAVSTTTVREVKKPRKVNKTKGRSDNAGDAPRFRVMPRVGYEEQPKMVSSEFVMVDGRVVYMPENDLELPGDEAGRGRVSLVRADARSFGRGYSPRGANLAAADGLRRSRGEVHPIDNRRAEDALPEQAACVRHRGDAFVATVVVSPVGGRYELAMLLEGDDGTPLSGGLIEWRLEGRAQAPVRVTTGEAWIGSCKGGTVEFSVKVPTRQELKISVRLEKPQITIGPVKKKPKDLRGRN